MYFLIRPWLNPCRKRMRRFWKAKRQAEKRKTDKINIKVLDTRIPISCLRKCLSKKCYLSAHQLRFRSFVFHTGLLFSVFEGDSYSLSGFYSFVHLPLWWQHGGSGLFAEVPKSAMEIRGNSGWSSWRELCLVGGFKYKYFWSIVIVLSHRWAVLTVLQPSPFPSWSSLV